MKIVEKKISELKEYENNPRNNDNAVDKDGVIVCDHTRVKAAQKLGMKNVPCIIADDLTPAQIKAFRIAEIIKIATGSKDIQVKVKGKHGCMTARGIRSLNSFTETTFASGLFKK